jgi:hypothetical protein
MIPVRERVQYAARTDCNGTAGCYTSRRRVLGRRSWAVRSRWPGFVCNGAADTSAEGVSRDVDAASWSESAAGVVFSLCSTGRSLVVAADVKGGCRSQARLQRLMWTICGVGSTWLSSTTEKFVSDRLTIRRGPCQRCWSFGDRPFRGFGV